MQYDMGRWIECFWDELADPLPERAPGRPSQGILYVPPPVNSLMFYDNIWQFINQEFGTAFDVAEVEEISEDMLAKVSQSISAYNDLLYRNLPRKSIVSSQPAFNWEIPADEMSGWLDEITSFLNESHKLGKTVLVVL